jgi:ParB family chromosome partitioning protein
MPKRDLKSAALKILNRETRPRTDHPIRHFGKADGFMRLPVELIRPNPDQPRKHFDPDALRDLTASVKEKGVLQPVLVRPDPDGSHFILIAGERRWRAAKAAVVSEIPALIRTEEDSLEVAIIENLQRENLHPLEEAEALLHLKTIKGFTDQALAQVIGKSRKAVNESLLLTQLPEAIKAEWRTSAMATKSQLLQVLRAGSPEKVGAAWAGLKTGEVSTVRELRKQKQQATAKKGRPAHYRFEHKPDGKPFHVTVTFAKKTASRAEVRSALKDALKHLP